MESPICFDLIACQKRIKEIPSLLNENVMLMLSLIVNKYQSNVILFTLEIFNDLYRLGRNKYKKHDLTKQDRLESHCDNLSSIKPIKF